ncbi:MAG: hypothetical protein O7C75_00575 [Verrucomicrobia bacterium]|nr:hypothetical protein [Verrucomicrobiota bacterium]
MKIFVTDSFLRWLLISLFISSFGSGMVFGQQDDEPALLIAYTKVQQPHQFPNYSGSIIPKEFSENPFSIYLLYQPESELGLDWLLCVEEQTADDWESLVSNENLLTIHKGAYYFYVRASSSVDEKSGVLDSVLDHLGETTSTAVIGGLMQGWHPALTHVNENVAASENLLGILWPRLFDHAAQFAPFVQWLASDFKAVESIHWEIDPFMVDGVSTLSMRTASLSRLYRLLDRKPQVKPIIFDFVPKTAEHLVFGSVDGASATNYINYIYRGTRDISDATFKDVRSGLDKLESGIFDRWDGSWAKWKPSGQESSMLLLGGKFLASDLSDLFEVFSELSFGETGLNLRLDENNSVVGFTRIRSLEFEGLPAGFWLGNGVQYFFGIGNGCLVIAEDENLIIDLIFKLNGKASISDSAQKLVEGNPGLSIASFNKGELTSSVQFTQGRMLFRQKGLASDLDPILGWMINNLLH